MLRNVPKFGLDLNKFYFLKRDRIPFLQFILNRCREASSIETISISQKVCLLTKLSLILFLSLWLAPSSMSLVIAQSTNAYKNTLPCYAVKPRTLLCRPDGVLIVLKDNYCMFKFWFLVESLLFSRVTLLYAFILVWYGKCFPF